MDRFSKKIFFNYSCWKFIPTSKYGKYKFPYIEEGARAKRAHFYKIVSYFQFFLCFHPFFLTSFVYHLSEKSFETVVLLFYGGFQTREHVFEMHVWLKARGRRMQSRVKYFLRRSLSPSLFQTIAVFVSTIINLEIFSLFGYSLIFAYFLIWCHILKFT